MKYTIQCCGPSKDFFLMPELSIETDTFPNPQELKILLLKYLSPEADKAQAQSMLDASLVASKEKILDNQKPIVGNEHLFLLPPVCGG
ncbi:MAG: hypothetical protein HYX60_06795 [Legionella longbeachae]|nr:hypothetical protein [Legionella longbeachae]